MRFILALAVLLSPTAALAQNEMLVGPIPVHKYVQTRDGTRCSPVQDGAGFSAADGYTRNCHWNDVTTQQQAMAAPQAISGPNIGR